MSKSGETERQGPMRWLFAMVLGEAVVVACGPHGRAIHGAPRGACAERPAAAPTLAAAPAFQGEESRIAVDIAVARARMVREISARVPRTLASERDREIGTPGRLSYTVSRGGFDVRLDRGVLSATTPIDVAIDVCKPLGPVCLRYGSCRSRLAASVHVPVSVGAEWRAPKSAVTFETTRACVIAPVGMDVSDRIESEARKRAGAVSAQVDAALPPLGEHARRVWAFLQVPIALDVETCLQVEPRSVSHGAPASEGDDLTVRLGATAFVNVVRPCPAPENRPSPAPLPPPTRAEVPAGVAIRLPLQLAWSEVSAAFTRALSDESTLTRVVASGATVEGRARVVLSVSVSGVVCGDGIVIAEPYYDVATARLALRNVHALDPRLADVARTVERLATMSLPIDANAIGKKLANQVRGLADDLPERVELDVDMRPSSIDRVEITATALVPVLAVDGSVRLAARE